MISTYNIKLFTRRRFLTPLLIFCASIVGLSSPVAAQTADDNTLRVLSTQRLSVLDVASPARTLAGYGLATMIYDNLITFNIVPTSNGFQESDMSDMRGELAESWSVSPDQKTITFVLKKDATFHSGAPVTIEDVKWSLDRAVSLPASQAFARTGGLVDPAQFQIIDKSTIEVSLKAPNRLALLVFGGQLLPIIDSTAAKAHSTPEDPWSIKWLEQNAAGSGAYKVESFKADEQITYRRFEEWRGGAKPYFERIVYQTVPETSNIIALLERGRADFSADVLLKDLPAIAARGKLDTASVSLRNSMDFVAMDTKSEKLRDPKVRQAIAYAMPYEGIYSSVYMSSGEMLNCAPQVKVQSPIYPQPYPYCTDYDKAKALLAEAGYADGFSLTFTYDTTRASIFEPMAVLMKESLENVGITLEIQKMVGSQFEQARLQHSLDFYGHTVNAWLGSVPDYWFSTFFQGDWRDNFGNYQSDEMDAILAEITGPTEQSTYDSKLEQVIQIAVDELPILPIRRRTIDVVQGKDITGYTVWFHGSLDLRQVRRK